MSKELQDAKETIRELLDLVGHMLTGAFYDTGQKAVDGGNVMKCPYCHAVWNNNSDGIGRHSVSCPVLKARVTLTAHGVDWMEL